MVSKSRRRLNEKSSRTSKNNRRNKINEDINHHKRTAGKKIIDDHSPSSNMKNQSNKSIKNNNIHSSNEKEKTLYFFQVWNRNAKIILIPTFIILILNWKLFPYPSAFDTEVETSYQKEFFCLVPWARRSGGCLKDDSTDTVPPSNSYEDKIQHFLLWLEDNGAVISPGVTIGYYDNYGFGLAAKDRNNVTVNTTTPQKKGAKKRYSEIETTQLPPPPQHQSQNYSINVLQDMFKIPSSIIISAESVLLQYESSHNYNLRSRLKRIATAHFPSDPLLQQDCLIALKLMVECALDHKSSFKPYLDILPMDIVPRLDTFGNEELMMLQDNDLAHLARASRKRLEHAWWGNSDNDSGRGRGHKRSDIRDGTTSSSDLQDVLEYMINVSTQTAVGDNDEEGRNGQHESISELGDGMCTSFQAFHKYMSIVSSRAMVLYGTKYLTPMADMANYAPRNTNSVGDGGGSIDPQYQPFTLYHHRNKEDSSITVRADRNFRPNEQIFEDYGDVDNSLYLEAHGFVPDENPHHCAMIPQQYLSIQPKDLSDGLWKAMVTLNVIPPSSFLENHSQPRKEDMIIPPICIKEDGTINDSRVIAYLKLSALAHKSNTNLEQKCVESLNTNDTELIMLECLHYPGHVDSMKHILRISALLTLWCGADTSLEEDVKLLDLSVQQRHRLFLQDGINVAIDKKIEGGDRNKEEVDATKIETALKFRISDKRILSEIVGDGLHLSHKNNTREECFSQVRTHIGNQQIDKKHQSSGGHLLTTNNIASTTKKSSTPTGGNKGSSMQQKLEQFNEFIDSLDIPIKKIKASFVGNGMRLGAIAINDLMEGETYFSISEASTISMDTTLSGDESKIFMSRTKHANQIRSKSFADEDGGIQSLIFFLLYERFVVKDESKWYPYLELLPNLSELDQTLHDVDDELIDYYLAGSNVRKNFHNYRKKVKDAYFKFLVDYDILMALGGLDVVSEQNFIWAHSIVDSRSIWWNGKRHLVPLLDLVNCMQLYNGKSSINAPHQTIVDPGNHHVVMTKATSYFQSGEQVYENYAQPNYIYLMYHGFMIPNNSHDCALWVEDEWILQIDQKEEEEDVVMKEIDMTKFRLRLNKFSLSSSATYTISSSPSFYYSPSFCIKNGNSLDKVANFIRIQLGIEGGDNHGLSIDLVDDVKFFLKRRLERYSKLSERRTKKSIDVASCIAMNDENNGYNGICPRLIFTSMMEKIVEQEVLFFETAYQDLLRRFDGE